MATLIRSSVVGKPRRIGAPTSTAPAPDVDPGSVENHASTHAETLSTEVEKRDFHTVSIDELQEAIETCKRNAALEVQMADERVQHTEQRLKEIEAELDSLKASAQQAGFEEGKRRGEAEGQAALEEVVSSLKGVVLSLNEQRVWLLEENEDRLVETVYGAVTRILGEALVREISAREVVLQVMRHVNQRDTMLIRVSPQDYESVKTLTTGAFGEYQVGAIEFAVDERVELGGCIVETKAGCLDGRLEVQLLRLKEVLLATRMRQRKEPERLSV